MVEPERRSDEAEEERNHDQGEGDQQREGTEQERTDDRDDQGETEAAGGARKVEDADRGKPPVASLDQALPALLDFFFAVRRHEAGNLLKNVVLDRDLMRGRTFLSLIGP